MVEDMFSILESMDCFNEGIGVGGRNSNTYLLYTLAINCPSAVEFTKSFL